MANAEEFWRPIINDFQPVGPVRPEQVRRFFVDRFEDDPTQSLIRQLKSDFLDSIQSDSVEAQPTHCKSLLTGHSGSGKSSELMRLADLLSQDFFVVWFDAERSLSARPNHFDVILGMGLALHLAAKGAGLRPSDQLTNKLVKSMARFIRKYEDRKGFSLKLDQLLKQVFAMVIGAGASAMGATPGDAAAAAAGAAATFGATQLELKVNDDLVRTLEMPAHRDEVIGALNEIIHWVQQKSDKPVLMVVDGLDKIKVDQARKLFAESSLLREPACALVYTAPIELYCRMSEARQIFNDDRLLPNLPVHKRPPTGDHWKTEREVDETHLEVLRKVVAKRLESRGHTLDGLIAPEAMTLLGRMSGGVMREMIRNFRDAARFARQLELTRIEEEIAHKVINYQRQEIDIRLTIPHRVAIRQVLQQGALSGGADAEREDELIRNLYLLRYQSGRNFWFDAYPNVLPLL
jgi:hypothetical protein